MNREFLEEWIASGMSPEDFPPVPDDPDSQKLFVKDLADGLVDLPESGLEIVTPLLPGILGDRVPVDVVVDALDSVIGSNVPVQKRLLLGELAVDFLILDENWQDSITRLTGMIEPATAEDLTGELAILFNYRGVCRYRLARYPEAQSDLEAGLRLAEETGSDRMQARARINLGLVFKEIGRLEEAAGHYKAALELARNSGDNRTLLSCYLNVGNIYKDLARWKNGIGALEKGIELASELGEDRERIRGRLNLGVLLLDHGKKLGEAESLFRDVMVEAEGIGADQLASIARSNLALTLVKLKRPEESLDYSQTSLDFSLKEGDIEGAWRAVANLARAYRMLDRIDEAEDCFETALGAFGEIRSRLVTDRDRSEYRSNLRSLHAEFIRFSLETRDPGTAFTRLARSKSRALLQARGSRTWSGESAEATDEELLDRIQASLAGQPDSIILDYVFLDDELKVFACDECEITVHGIELPESGLRALLEDFYKEVNLFIASREYRDAQWGKNEKIPDDLVELGRALIGPVGDRISNRKRLIVVPQGLLHGVPFAALSVSDGEYLIETHSISILPSSDFIISDLEPWAVKDPKLVVLKGEEEGLEGVGEEIAQLKDIFAGRIAVEDPGELLGRDGMKRLGKVLKDADALHFAGHAEFDRSDPYASALLLPGGTRLTAEDILTSGIRLEKTGLVVLAGCETGKGEVLSGDEVIGIARAFLAIGAGAVLVSLWRVSDRATAELIPGVYKEWLAGKGLPDALRDAILGLMSRSRVHPYFFAPFQLVGPGR